MPETTPVWQLALCERCGFTVLKRSLRRDPVSGLMVCQRSGCLDKEHPAVVGDRQRKARLDE